MKKSIVVLALFIGAPALAVQTKYRFDGIWTGANGFSSAPSPSCSFDRDPNRVDGGQIISVRIPDGVQPPDLCYDEFIPAVSAGWVHAYVYRRIL